MKEYHVVNRSDTEVCQNAKLLGLANGHHTAKQGVGPGTKALSAEQWEVVIMIAYVGLILFQVPGCIGFRIFSPSKV